MKEELLLSLDAFVVELRKEDRVLAELLPREENSYYELDLLKNSLLSSPLPSYSINPTEWKIHRLAGIAIAVQIQHSKFGMGSEAIGKMADTVVELYKRYRHMRIQQRYTSDK